MKSTSIVVLLVVVAAAMTPAAQAQHCLNYATVSAKQVGPYLEIRYTIACASVEEPRIEGFTIIIPTRGRICLSPEVPLTETITLGPLREGTYTIRIVPDDPFGYCPPPPVMVAFSAVAVPTLGDDALVVLAVMLMVAAVARLALR